MKLTVYTIDGRMHIFKDREARDMATSIQNDCGRTAMTRSCVNDQGAVVSFFIKNIVSTEVAEG